MSLLHDNVMGYMSPTTTQKYGPNLEAIGIWKEYLKISSIVRVNFLLVREYVTMSTREETNQHKGPNNILAHLQISPERKN